MRTDLSVCLSRGAKILASYSKTKKNTEKNWRKRSPSVTLQSAKF